MAKQRRFYSAEEQEMERAKAIGQWEALVLDVDLLAKATGVPVYKQKNVERRGVNDTLALTMNNGSRYDGGGPYAGLMTRGKSYSRQYKVEIGSVGRLFQGPPSFQRAVENTTASMLYAELVEQCQKQRDSHARKVEDAQKRAAAEQHMEAQKKRDIKLLGTALSYLAGPGHHASVKTDTSGYAVHSTFEITVSEEASPEIRDEFEAIVRQWRRIADANPYPNRGET